MYLDGFVTQENLDKYINLFGEEEPYIGDKEYFPNRYPRAAYASIISYLDEQVGEIVTIFPENKKKKILQLLQYVNNHGLNLINWNEKNEIVFVHE